MCVVECHKKSFRAVSSGSANFAKLAKIAEMANIADRIDELANFAKRIAEMANFAERIAEMAKFCRGSIAGSTKYGMFLIQSTLNPSLQNTKVFPRQILPSWQFSRQNLPSQQNLPNQMKRP